MPKCRKGDDVTYSGRGARANAVETASAAAMARSIGHHIVI